MRKAKLDPRIAAKPPGKFRLKSTRTPQETDSLEAHAPPAPERHRSPHPQTRSPQKRPRNSLGGTALRTREASERGGEPAAGGDRTDGTLAPHASSAALGVGGSRRIRGFSWAAARAKGGTGASERAEGIIPNVEVVTEKAQSGRIFCEEPSTEKTVCYRCSANKAHGLCFGPDGCICRAHLEGLTFAS